MGRKERQGHGWGSWAGPWREEAGLGRVGLAFAEAFCSLRMMRATQGWSGGAQSWRPLTVVNLESEVREKGALKLSCLEGPGVRARGWGPYLWTCFRDFLEGVGLGKEKRDKLGYQQQLMGEKRLDMLLP